MVLRLHGRAADPTLSGKRFWDSLQVAPVYLIAIETLAFALAFTGRAGVMTKPAWGVIWALPAVHVGAALTAPWNGYEYADARLVRAEPFDVLSYSFTLLDTAGYLFSLCVLPLTFGLLVSHCHS